MRGLVFAITEKSVINKLRCINLSTWRICQEISVLDQYRNMTGKDETILLIFSGMRINSGES